MLQIVGLRYVQDIKEALFTPLWNHSELKHPGAKLNGAPLKFRTRGTATRGRRAALCDECLLVKDAPSVIKKVEVRTSEK